MKKGRKSALAGGGFGDDLYRGTVMYGKFQAWVSLFWGTVFSLIALSLGVWLVSRPQPRQGKARATVVSADCENNAAADNSYKCRLGLRYVVDGKEYTPQITVTRSNHVYVGSTIDIRYDTRNPLDMEEGGLSSRLFGWIVIGVGLLIAGSSIMSWYAATHYTVAAAALGTGSAIGTIGSAFDTLRRGKNS